MRSVCARAIWKNPGCLEEVGGELLSSDKHRTPHYLILGFISLTCVHGRLLQAYVNRLLLSSIMCVPVRVQML